MDYDYKKMADRYRLMHVHGNGMFREAMWQYEHMARGGDGGELGWTPNDWAQICVDQYKPTDTIPTIRAYNYPGYPNSFFRKVLEQLTDIIDR
jgi:hypothetical protein|tara:strand:+ start:363 stop:641 length:279 start_codon:yes stop_codon:yes gene_type:complete